MTRDERMSRRKVIKSIAGGVVAAAAGNAAAQTKPATAPAIPPDEIDTLDRALGWDYTQDDRKLMGEDLADFRARMKSLRSRTIDPGIEPAIRFDPRLPGAEFASGQSSFQLSKADLPGYDGNPQSLAFESAANLSRLIHALKVSSTELTKMYLARLKQLSPKLLCTVNLTEELALSQAKRADEELAAGKSRGALHGIPYGAKDLLATKGIPTTWGVKPFEHQVFDYDATVISRLESAGAVLLAKLSLGELAMGDVWFGGKTRNPWKLEDGSSGSSAGPGSTTTAGLVGFSIGTETLGSIVSPCVTTGCTGLRPTYGRVPRTGAMPLCRTMDKIGPMTRAVEDCAMVLSAIAGPDGHDATVAGVPFCWNPSTDPKSLRVGVDEHAFDLIKQSKYNDVREIYLAALERIRAIAGELKPVKLPDIDNYKGLANFIITVESASSFTELNLSGRLKELVQQDGNSWPNTFRVGSLIPAADYLRAMQVRTMLQQEMARTFTEIDLYVTIPFLGPTLAFTNLTGHPTLVTRCGMHNGLPKSIEFVGNLYREDAICCVAHAFERATEWHKQWPVVDGN